LTDYYFSFSSALTKQFIVNFPDKCIYCGKPQTTTKSLLATGNTASYNKIVTSTLELAAPYCDSCSQEAEKNEKIIGIISLATFGISAILTYLIVKDTIRLNFIAGLLLGITVFAFMGMFMNFLVGMIARLLGSMIRPTLIDMPMFGSIPLLGIGARMLGSSNVEIYVANDEIAREFAEMNKKYGYTFWESFFQGVWQFISNR